MRRTFNMAKDCCEQCLERLLWAIMWAVMMLLAFALVGVIAFVAFVYLIRSAYWVLIQQDAAESSGDVIKAEIIRVMCVSGIIASGVLVEVVVATLCCIEESEDITRARRARHAVCL